MLFSMRPGELIRWIIVDAIVGLLSYALLSVFPKVFLWFVLINIVLLVVGGILTQKGLLDLGFRSVGWKLSRSYRHGRHTIISWVNDARRAAVIVAIVLIILCISTVSALCNLPVGILRVFFGQ